MIKKLDKSEVPEILPIRRGKDTLLRTMLLKLEVGETLFLPKQDWKAKTGPYYIVSKIKQKFGYRYEHGPKDDGTGWLFRRIG